LTDEPEPRTDPRFYAIRDAALANRAEAAILLAHDSTLIEVKNSIGETALHFLVVEDDRPSVEWLMERGAGVNTQNDFGNTPFMEAAGLGYLEMCEFLLSRGADMEVRNESAGTALSEAAQSGQQSVVEMLLARLPVEADINAYFDPIEAEMVLDVGGAIADLLSSRGLRRPL
jgi:ankyrin repeat protein